jgi:hypothetical protein
MDNNLLYNGTLSGTSILFSMLSGQLLMENMKMEKQRTNKSYIDIYKVFYRRGINGYLSGFIPWGVLMGFGKGFIVGGISKKIEYDLNDKNISDNNKQIIKGVGTGIFESIYMNPIMMARAKTNEYIGSSNYNKEKIFKKSLKILNSSINKNGIKSIYSGIQLLALRRSIDWSSRFFIIHKFQNFILKKYDIDELSLYQRLYTTAIGSAITTPFSTPIDRLLPIIYTSDNYKKSIEKIKYNIKKNGYKRTFFSGLLIRAISTGYYTTFLLFVPYIINNKLYKKNI